MCFFIRTVLNAWLLAGPPCGRLQNYPILELEKRKSPRRSHTKTRVTMAKTFERILPWTDFSQGASELFESLDDSEQKYYQPVCSVVPSSSVPSAADEAEVRGRVVSLLDSLNAIAEAVGIPVHCTGGGSGRSASVADLVVRPAGAHSNPMDLSSQIYGTGEVKSDWQFKLYPGERLEEPLHDPKRIDNILLAIQQVGSDETSIVLCFI